MKKIQLIIERGADRKYWGRITFKDNLLIDSANNVSILEKKMKRILNDFHSKNDFDFEHVYDVSAFFDNFDFLNQSKIAKVAGINPALLRQYASGIKFPSSIQAKKIEFAIHKLAKELSAVSFYTV